MLSLIYDGCRVTIAEDPTYAPGSVDNVRSYSREYFLGGQEHRPWTRQCVLVSREAREIASCILLTACGLRGVTDHSAIVRGDNCVVAAGKYLASLVLPRLELAWAAEVDFATCFGVYHSPNHGCYVSHGEVDIACVSYDGKVVWRYSGEDIFSEGFTLHDDRVEAIDYNQTVHRIPLDSGEGTVVKRLINLL